jgi:hypothetical protein
MGDFWSVYLDVAPKAAERQVAAANHQQITIRAGQITALGMKHTVGKSDWNEMVFLSDTGRLPFSEAHLITVNIRNDPNVAATGFHEGVLENVRLEKSQTQSVSRKQCVLPATPRNYFQQ